MKKIHSIYLVICGMMMSGCGIYGTYERPEGLPVDSLFRDVRQDTAATDTMSLGTMPWRQLFQDAHLQRLIECGLEKNTDLLVALLRVDQAKAQLKAAKLAFLPSLSLSPQGTLTSVDGNKPTKTYELPVEASWEIDIFGIGIAHTADIQSRKTCVKPACGKGRGADSAARIQTGVA